MPVIFAYLDPGTGSYLLQIGLGGLFAVTYAAARFWNRIKQFVRRSSSSSPDDALN